MIAIVFEWDEIKAKNNYRKHGISFDEAKSVFYDEEAVLFFDEIHSVKEDRFILLGKTSKSRIILVCHCYLETKGIIRIFSSRRATKNESKHYPRRKR